MLSTVWLDYAFGIQKVRGVRRRGNDGNILFYKEDSENATFKKRFEENK